MPLPQRSSTNGLTETGQAAESPGYCSSRRESGTGPRATGRAERRLAESSSLTSALPLDQGGSRATAVQGAATQLSFLEREVGSKSML
jgi:hypothetical protein